jgi:hypothetical protein
MLAGKTAAGLQHFRLTAVWTSPRQMHNAWQRLRRKNKTLLNGMVQQMRTGMAQVTETKRLPRGKVDVIIDWSDVWTSESECDGSKNENWDGSSDGI